MGHMLHHQGLALDEEMIHEERVGAASVRWPRRRPYGAGPARAARGTAERVS